jgi:hypothetical protein
MIDEVLERCREQLAEEDAVAVDRQDVVSVPLLGDQELPCTWEEVASDDMPYLVEFLETYTSTQNTVPRQYVDNPTINQVVYPGRYRLAFVRRQTSGGDISKLIRVLRKGYITSLVSASTLDWSEARLERGRELPAGTLATNPGGNTVEQYFTVKWQNVSPSHIKAITTALNGLGVSSFSPTIKGESYGSGYHRIYTDYRIEEDGSGTVFMLLGSPEFRLQAFLSYGTGRASDATYLWGCPKELAQAVLTAARAANKEAFPSYSSNDGLVDIVIKEKATTGGSFHNWKSASNCDSDTINSFYWGVYDPELYKIPASVAAGDTYNADVRDNSDGTYDVILSLRRRKTRTYEDQHVAASSLENAYLDTILGTTGDEPDITANVQGVVYDQSIRINDDCSKDIDTRRIVSIEKEYHYTSATSALDVQYAHMYHNSRDLVYPPDHVQGSVCTASNRMNRDGTYDASVTDQQSIESAITVSWLTSGGRVYMYDFKNQRMLPDDYLQALSSARSNTVQANIGQDGTYNVTIQSAPKRGSGGRVFEMPEDVTWDWKTEDDRNARTYIRYIFSASAVDTFMSDSGPGFTGGNGKYARPGSKAHYLPDYRVFECVKHVWELGPSPLGKN